MKKFNISYVDCHSIGTIVHIAIDNKYAGHILISDLIKPTAKQAIQELKNIGIKKLLC